MKENSMCDFDCSTTTQEIFEVFKEEISARQGKVTDTFNDGARLFARSVLPHVEEIRARDKVQAGVALRVTATAACVYPYIFRLVCKNGAIMAHAAEGREIANPGSLPPFEMASLLREAIESCCDQNAFATAAAQMRQAAHQPIDAILNMMPFLSRLFSQSPELARQVLNHFTQDEDQTSYGLMNAITSVARESRDHEARWRLEELGGQMAVLAADPEPVLDDGA